MNRSILVLLSLGLVATPAFAQQPLQPAPSYPQAYAPPAQPQYDPNAQMQPPQPLDPYAQYGDADDEDDQMDVTYDISTDPQEQQYDDGYDPNAYQQFESTLSPYGSWQEVPNYGRVWVPSTAVVGDDFEPYSTGGHWVDSDDYGWTWASDWDWGWAPFHYGRWMILGGYGWCWMPGTTWGPAWVDWRWGGGYVGWAPMGPRGVVIGPPRGVRSPWHFTVANQLGAYRPHYLPSRVIPSVWRSTTAIHNVSTVNLHGTPVRFNAGPSARMVAAATGRAVTPVSLRSVAPRALPSQAIAPRVGAPLQSRPWMQPRPLGAGAVARVPHTLGSQPIYSRPGTTTIQGRPQPLYRSPQPLQYRSPAAQPYRAYGYTPQRNGTMSVYSNGHYYGAPAQSYHPAPQYHYGAPAPMQSYHAAPSYHYAAPSSYQAAPSYHYATPSQSFRAPSQSFHSAPAFHSSGGFSGGGSTFHGGGGGGFHSAGSAGFHGGGRR